MNGRPFFLITNTTPLNGGDQALLTALLSGLRNRWPECRIAILSSAVNNSRAFMPGEELYPDLEHAESGRVSRFYMRKAGNLRRLLPGSCLQASLDYLTASSNRKKILELYKSADLVISAPGGFLHDFYFLEDRLKGFETALALKKPLFFFCQSMGPFWKKKSKKWVCSVLQRAAGVVLRDLRSLEHLTGIGLKRDDVVVAADAAFLLYPQGSILEEACKAGKDNTIALCFRAWPVGDNGSLETIIEKASVLVKYLVEEHGAKILFLSTCQGVPGYVDDSLISEEIVKRLPLSIRERCSIEKRRLGPLEMASRLSKCSAFIGMRLHGAILSMLGGTPAMGIGYEEKTKEVFTQMGLEEYQLPYTESAEKWIKCASLFLRDLSQIEGELPQAMERQKERASLALDLVEKALALCLCRET